MREEFREDPSHTQSISLQENWRKNNSQVHIWHLVPTGGDARTNHNRSGLPLDFLGSAASCCFRKHLTGPEVHPRTGSTAHTMRLGGSWRVMGTCGEYYSVRT